MTAFPTGNNILQCSVPVTPPWPKSAFSQSVGIHIPGPIQLLVFPQNSLPVQCLAGKEVTTLKAERESTASTHKAASPKRAVKSTSKCLLGPWHSSNKPGVIQPLLQIFKNCFPHNTAQSDPLATGKQGTPWMEERHQCFNAQIGFGRVSQDLC